MNTEKELKTIEVKYAIGHLLTLPKRALYEEYFPGDKHPTRRSVVYLKYNNRTILGRFIKIIESNVMIEKKEGVGRFYSDFITRYRDTPDLYVIWFDNVVGMCQAWKYEILANRGFNTNKLQRGTTVKNILVSSKEDILGFRPEWVQKIVLTKEDLKLPIFQKKSIVEYYELGNECIELYKKNNKGGYDPIAVEILKEEYLKNL